MNSAADQKRKEIIEKEHRKYKNKLREIREEHNKEKSGAWQVFMHEQRKPVTYKKVEKEIFQRYKEKENEAWTDYQQTLYNKLKLLEN